MTVMEPDVPSVPDQVPLPVQARALVLVHERVALWPGITALGLMETLAVAFGAGGVEMMFELPLLQPERTKAERRNMTKTKERVFRDSTGTFIAPRSMNPL